MQEVETSYQRDLARGCSFEALAKETNIRGLVTKTKEFVKKQFDELRNLEAMVADAHKSEQIVREVLHFFSRDGDFPGTVVLLTLLV